MTWTQTTRGRRLDLLDPQPDDVSIPEIALALGNQCRYAGCIRRFYSVAEHSVLISRALERDGHSVELRLAGLLHDAAEAYTGDITWPVQAALWSTPSPAPAPWHASPPGEEVKFRYKVIQERLNAIICKHAEFAPEWLHSEIVKEYDLRILLDERDALLGPAPEPWYPERVGLAPLGVTIHGWTPEAAQAAWWRRFVDLQAERLVERAQ